MASNGETMKTEKQKDYVIHRWNLCESNEGILMAAEYFKLKRSYELVAVPRTTTVNLTQEKRRAMTNDQQQDLLIEWDLYQPQQQEAMITEFRNCFRGSYTKTDLFEFLKNKLQIEGYWRKVGLA